MANYICRLSCLLLFLSAFLTAFDISDAATKNACSSSTDCSKSGASNRGVEYIPANILTAIYEAPEDMAASDDFYGNGAQVPGVEDCAAVQSITRDESSGEFVIKLKLNIDGRGCNTSLPWTVAPRIDGQIVQGVDALTTCDAGGGGCTRIASGPLNSLLVVVPPPVYRAPLTNALNSLSDKPVPFGYAGYHTYETNSKGTCGDYGFTQMTSKSASTQRKGSVLGVALAKPRENECNGDIPQQGAFTSIFTPKEVARRLGTWLNFQMGGTNATQLALTNLALSINNTIISTGTLSAPYRYLNLAEIFGITDPFRCGDSINSTSSNSTYSIGSSPEEAHSCPMSLPEWESVLQDVAQLGVNIDELIGPNTDTLGTLPMVCYRCSRLRGDGAQSQARAVNYASRHFPISMSFGPQCAGLVTENSRQSVRVAVGGYVGVSSTTNPYDGKWIVSAGFPVRYAKSIGSTSRTSSVRAPAASVGGGAEMPANLTWTSGTSGTALKIDMNNLRYILCNGGGGVVMPSGVNTTTGQTVGPLVSKLIANISEAITDLGPVWPNPFRWVDIPGMPDCSGCTYPTIATQKGWTVMDSQIWHYGQHNGVGGFHFDHSIWSRILALVNGTSELLQADVTNIMSTWNSTSGLADLFAEGAKSLSQNDINEFLQELADIGIPGIGTRGWMSSACDQHGHSGRPTPRSIDTLVTRGLVATPMCWLLRRQLYSQSQARFSGNGNSTGVGDNLVDLGSAQRTGIFNGRAPNVWFGVWQRQASIGDSQWQVFMGDTWDRTGGSIFGDKGMADDVEGTMEFRVPISSVETISGPTEFNVTGFGDGCGVAVFPATTTIQSFTSTVDFMSPSPSAISVSAEYIPQNCLGSLVYDLDSVTVVTDPISFSTHTVQYGPSNPVTGQNSIIVTMPYDTVGISVEYAVGFNFVCSAPIDPGDTYGFDISVSYVQYNSPTSSFTNKLGSSGFVPCDRQGNETSSIASINTYYMEALRPPVDSLPDESVCYPVYLENPILSGIIIIGETNMSAVFTDEAKNSVRWDCLTYSRIDDLNNFASCNVSGNGDRVGNCTAVDDFYGGVCQNFWDLQCYRYRSQQIMFMLSLFFWVPLFLMLTILIVQAIILRAGKGKRDAVTQLFYEQMGEKVTQFEKEMFRQGVIQERFKFIQKGY
jgi:hypothetical protein